MHDMGTYLHMAIYDLPEGLAQINPHFALTFFVANRLKKIFKLIGNITLFLTYFEYGNQDRLYKISLPKICDIASINIWPKIYYPTLH